MLLCPWDSPGKNTGVGCHSLLQGIFTTQGSNPCLLFGRQILYHWATWEAPYNAILKDFLLFFFHLCIFNSIFILSVKPSFKKFLLYFNFIIYLSGCAGSELCHVGSSSLARDGTLHWNPGVLATGPPGKSQHFHIWVCWCSFTVHLGTYLQAIAT